MTLDETSKLTRRIARAAEAALPDHSYVSILDVLQGIGWLTASHIDRWRQGRTPNLEAEIQASPTKVSELRRIFRSWVEDKGLRPTETNYVARTRDRRPLQFSLSRDSDVELACRTHWVSPQLSEAKRERLAEKQSRPPDLVVISALKAWTCTDCGTSDEDLLFMEDAGPLCLACADMDHLVFLPSGDAALTRRARKASTLAAVVVRFSRARGRYERQGLLVEEPALAQAEEECRGDEESRRLRRARDEQRRAQTDAAFEASFAERILELYPRCPRERAASIAGRAAARGSGRVGRSAAGRALDPQAATLAVAASVRHEETRYDELLMAGMGRADARQATRAAVEEVLATWQAVEAP